MASAEGETKAPAAHPQPGEGGPHPQARTAQKPITFEGATLREGTDGASSESPHGWRGGEGGWVGVPRLQAHAGGHVRTRPVIAYQLISGRCGQVPAEMATVRSGNVGAMRACARRDGNRA